MLDISDYSFNNKHLFNERKYSIANKSVIQNFFNDLKRSYDKINTLSFNYELYAVNLEEYKLEDKKFFPLKMQQEIRLKLKYIYYTNVYIRKRNVIIHVITENKDNKKYKKYIFLMLMWLDILGKYADKECVKTINIYIYLCDKCKELPSENQDIGAEHINSGYSYAGCNKKSEITVYRKEEWFKVFIHETIHAFNLGFELLDSNYINNELYKKFGLNIDFYAPECYCESWGVIWNSLFNAFIKEKKRFDIFFNKFNDIYNMECNFTNSQCLKLEKFKQFDSNYKENTPIFSYFFLKRILLLRIDDFLDFCKNNNKTMLNFKKDIDSLNKFILLLDKNDGHYKNAMIHDNSTRMTLIDFH